MFDLFNSKCLTVKYVNIDNKQIFIRASVHVGDG